MSNANEEKIYAPVSAKQIKFQSTGNTILKLGINVEKFVAFLKQHQNEKGFVNLGISERKSVGQYGDTHSVWLDTWKPEAQAQNQARPAAKAAAKPVAKPVAGDEPPESDDVPF